MTYFKLDIPSVNGAIESYKRIKKNCIEDIENIYGSLGYTESAWNDANSPIFIQKIKSDKYKMNNYFNYLDGLYAEIENFKNNIGNICSKYGYKKDSIILKFDDNRINECKKNLNYIIKLMNISLNYININSFETNFENINLIYTLRSEINNIKKMTNYLLNLINDFSNSINKELNNSMLRLKRKKGYSFNLYTSNYNWKIKDLNVKPVNTDDISAINVSTTKFNTNFESNISNIGSSINSYLVQSEEIKTEKLKEIDGLDNNLNGYVKETTEFNINDEEKLNNYINNNAQINNFTQTEIFGLNNSMKNIQYNDQEILFDDAKTDLNKNIDKYASENREYNFNADANYSVNENTNNYNTGNTKTEVDKYNAGDIKIGDFVS